MNTAAIRPELHGQIIDLITECITAVKKQRSISADDLVTEAKAAEMLGLAKGTLNIGRHDVRGPSYVKLESAVRYRYQDLQEYIRQRSVQAGV